MSEATREEQAVAMDLAHRRLRAVNTIGWIRRCISQMQRPKCKQHIKMRRLRQIAVAIDHLGELGFDDLGDGALITALTDALKLDRTPDRSRAIHDIYEALDLFQRQVMGEEISPDVVG